MPAGAGEEIFELVDEMNRNTLSQVQEMINQGIEDGFVKDKDVYTFTTKIQEADDTKLTVDLSDYESPCIEMVVDYSNDTSDLQMNDRIRFSNIDNTVIEINDNDFIEFYSVKNFEKEMFAE